ncbi:MAG: hypothetical protein KDB22_06530 [Planctomycetales bacterium]|nr:hypothetical protein [Planctomycetales bacterium]
MKRKTRRKQQPSLFSALILESICLLAIVTVAKPTWITGFWALEPQKLVESSQKIPDTEIIGLNADYSPHGWE